MKCSGEKSNAAQINEMRYWRNQMQAGKMKCAPEKPNAVPIDGMQHRKNQMQRRLMEFSTGKAKCNRE